MGWWGVSSWFAARRGQTGVTDLDAGIIGRPGNEGELVSAKLLGPVPPFDCSNAPDTVARGQAVLKVVDGVSGTLADSALQPVRFLPGFLVSS